MTRLYIVEQSGLEPGGHYHAYTSCVVEGARQLGLDPVVLVNKRFRGTGSPLELIPCFTYTWGEAEVDGTLEWAAGNIACEMFGAFRRVPPAVDDHVFLHTLGYRELLAILAWLTSRLPGDPMPYFHIMLRRDPEFLIDNFKQYSLHFATIAASPYFRQKILFHADTHQLSAAFTRLCGVPFATAPIPFDQSLLLAAQAARAPRRAGDPLTVVYLGDAREEKGYQHLPQALSFLWKDHIARGRVRFVLQSNFNTPGGETGIMAASQNLAAFPATILKSAPLQPAEYFQILADADVVLIPYSAPLYRLRSSGILVEAIGAGKVVVTSARSWMATQVTPDQAVLFSSPAGIGPAIAEAIDRFDELSAGAEAGREAALAQSTGENLVRHLLRRSPAAVLQETKRRRILYVMDGGSMVLSNGASRTANAQLKYLAAAGYDIVGLFLTFDEPESGKAFASWRDALGRAIAPVPFERVFLAGAGYHGFDLDQGSSIRALRQATGMPLQADFDFASTFEFPGALLKFLRAHPVDAVLLNYITNYPVVDALGLEGVPVICETHDLQSFQRAIHGQRLVDAADLDDEFQWLSRCAGLISVSGRETAIVRERLPGIPIETTGIFLPTPRPALPCLAGAKDLAEIVSSTDPLLPEYQFETAWEIEKTDTQQRLIEAKFLDILFVSSAHPSNVPGLKWFLSQVYEPYLANRHISMVVAGSICRIADWPSFPRLFLIDQVADLAPLYAAARVVVLPITEGAGIAIKSFEALAYGRPIVGTSHAFRGFDGDLGGFIIRDDAAGFADAILTLLNSEEERERSAASSCRAAERYNDFGTYFKILDNLFGQALGEPIPPTPAPQAIGRDTSYVEWSPRLNALNRVVRSYLEGEPLEWWALRQLALDSKHDLDTLIERIAGSLVGYGDAALLRTEQRLRRYVANAMARPRPREDLVFAIQLALSEHSAVALVRDAGDTIARIVVPGGLPVEIVGAANGADPSIVVDGQAVGTRRIAETYLGGGELFLAEVGALEQDRAGLRTIELGTAVDEGDNARRSNVALLRQSLPISPRVTLLGRDVFGGAFEFRDGGAGADLPPGATGVVLLPRVADGRSSSFVELCFTRPDDNAADDASTGFADFGISILLNNRSPEIELVPFGPVTIATLLLGVYPDAGDFGVVPLTIVNKDAHLPVRLVEAHSGLLLGPIIEASRVATVLTQAGRRLEQAGDPAIAERARKAVASTILGNALSVPTLAALRSLAIGEAGREKLRTMAVQELSRALRENGKTLGTVRNADSVMQDVDTIVGSCLGTANEATTIICPALPVDVVDESGQSLPARTDAALRGRDGSWRVPMPSDGTPQRIRIRLDAALEVAGHPDLVTFTGFHPPESPEAGFRWTGPEPISTITIPVALNNPAHLVIKLGWTGKNDAARDFTISCNGTVVSHILETDGRDATLTADLPPFRLAGPLTEIGLMVNKCFNPEPPDRRTLGVVFRSLSLYLNAQDERGSVGHPLPATVIKSEEPVDIQPEGIPTKRGRGSRPPSVSKTPQ